MSDHEAEELTAWRWPRGVGAGDAGSGSGARSVRGNRHPACTPSPRAHLIAFTEEFNATTYGDALRQSCGPQRFPHHDRAAVLAAGPVPGRAPPGLRSGGVAGGGQVFCSVGRSGRAPVRLCTCGPGGRGTGGRAGWSGPPGAQLFSHSGSPADQRPARLLTGLCPAPSTTGASGSRGGQSQGPAISRGPDRPSTEPDLSAAAEHLHSAVVGFDESSSGACVPCGLVTG